MLELNQVITEVLLQIVPSQSRQRKHTFKKKDVTLPSKTHDKLCLLALISHKGVPHTIKSLKNELLKSHSME